MGFLNTDDMIDYAAGYGTLSNILKKYFNIELRIFDPYIHNGDKSRYIDEKQLKTYKTVINSAMFEHILKRDDLDYVNKLVDSDGCLIIHTMVCENLPNDQNWFYLLPVHTAFHTNKSMQVLMQQWGYKSSIYCLRSRCWVIFKTKPRSIKNIIFSINQELQSDWFYYIGFVDYWKDF